MRRILLVAFAFTFCWLHAFAQNDQEIEAAAQRALRAYSLSGIQLSAQNKTITLTGLVNLCRDKLLAIQVTRRIHGVQAIDDRIEVDGPRVPDAQLQAQVDRIIQDRIRSLGGFGFGSMKARLKDGVVTLSGTAALRLSEPAIAAIAGTSGVKGLVDHVGRVAAYDTGWHSNRPGFAFAP